jgi:hypothetical protein
MSKVVFAALLVMIAGTAAGQVREREARDDANAPATKVELFQRGSTLLIEGTNVHLEDMRVRSKSGVMMRVAYGRHEIYVAPIDPSALDFIAKGARVDVRGSLRAAPSAAQARLVYAMSAREARRLARQRVYVDAWSVNTR